MPKELAKQLQPVVGRNDGVSTLDPPCDTTTQRPDNEGVGRLAITRFDKAGVFSQKRSGTVDGTPLRVGLRNVSSCQGRSVDLPY